MLGSKLTLRMLKKFYLVAQSSEAVNNAQAKFDAIHEEYRNGSRSYKDYLDAWHDLARAKRLAGAQSYLPSGNGIVSSSGDGWNGWFNDTPERDQDAQCRHDWKVYDSGFSRFQYCSKCNEEKKEE